MLTEIEMNQENAPVEVPLKELPYYEWFVVDMGWSIYLGQRLNPQNEPHIDLEVESPSMETVLCIDKMDMEVTPKILHKSTVVTRVESIEFNTTLAPVGQTSDFVQSFIDDVVAVKVGHLPQVDNYAADEMLFLLDVHDYVTTNQNNKPTGVWGCNVDDNRPLEKIQINYTI